MSDSIVPFLPFTPRDERKRRDMIAKILEICGSFKHSIYILDEEDFSKIFQEDGFKESYDEHRRIYDLTVSQGKLKALSIPEDLFLFIAINLFEGRTGRKVKNNSRAFRVFLSLLKRKDNEVRWQEAMPKEKPYSPNLTSRQMSLFH